MDKLKIYNKYKFVGIFKIHLLPGRICKIPMQIIAPIETPAVELNQSKPPKRTPPVEYARLLNN